MDKLLALISVMVNRSKCSEDAYEEAQKALKENEEQYFTREEKNKLVPERLRK